MLHHCCDVSLKIGFDWINICSFCDLLISELNPTPLMFTFLDYLWSETLQCISSTTGNCVAIYNKREIPEETKYSVQQWGWQQASDFCSSPPSWFAFSPLLLQSFIWSRPVMVQKMGKWKRLQAVRKKVNKKTTPTISAQGESSPQSEGVGIRTMAES